MQTDMALQVVSLKQLVPLMEGVAQARVGAAPPSELGVRIRAAYDQLDLGARVALPGWALRGLKHPLLGREGEETGRALALFAARVGASEVAEAATAHHVGEIDRIHGMEAVDRLFTRITTWAASPGEAFYAKVKDPQAGFEPFCTENGTEMVFYPSPESLGEPWADLINPHWENGIGLIVYRNREAGCVGMVFIHSLARCAWTKIAPGQPIWQTSGGSMAKEMEKVSFRSAMEQVVDKGGAMTDKWPAVTASLTRAGLTRFQEMGGMKGLVLYDTVDSEGYRKSLAVHAEVIRLLGVPLTGSDEGIDAMAADFMAELAPNNIYGSPKSNYKGRKPTDWTAAGIFEGLHLLYDRYYRRSDIPIFVQGYGGIGTQLVEKLVGAGIPVAGIVDARPAVIQAARRKFPRIPSFVGGRGAGITRPIPGTETDSQIDLLARQGIDVRWGLAELLAECPDTRAICTNATTHPFTFENTAAMILHGGIVFGGGSTNNQLGLDTEGSFVPMAWILFLAGIRNPTDYFFNRLGATAVASDVIGLDDDGMRGQVSLVGTFALEELQEADQQGIPPSLARLRQVRRMWAETVQEGRGIGGVRKAI